MGAVMIAPIIKNHQLVLIVAIGYQKLKLKTMRILVILAKKEIDKMQKEITQKVWCCDVCGKQNGFIGTCDICGKEYCSLCEYFGYNPLNINICKDHQNDSDMKVALESFDKK